MAEAKRDQNHVTTLLGVSSVDGVTPVVLWADPTTHRLLVDLAGGSATTLQTNGVANGNQSLLNLVEGTNITLTDNGTGSVTIDATGGGGTPGGTNRQIQFNNSSAFGGAKLDYARSTVGEIYFNADTYADEFYIKGAPSNGDTTTSGNIYLDSGLVRGVISSVAIDTDGTGYTVNDVITIVDSFGVGSGATYRVDSIGGGGEVLTGTLLTGGTNYSIGTSRSFTGGTGVGLFLDIAELVGKINSGDVNISTEAPVNGGDGGSIVISSSNVSDNLLGAITTENLNNAGTGYTVNDVLTIGGGTGGQITVDTIGGGGSISDYRLTASGSGYTTATGATLTGGTGASATIDIVVKGGDSGGLSLYTGSSFGAVGGINIACGSNDGTGTTVGANVSVDAGSGASTGNGGNVLIGAGIGGSTSGNGGNIVLSPGAVTSGTAGRVKLIDGVSGQAAVLDTSVIATTDKTFTFPNATGTLVLNDNTATITNKRNQSRTASSTTSSNLSPNLSTANVYFRTTQTATLTIDAPTGTPVIGEVITLYVDSAGAQTLTINATYKAFGAAFPATTTAGKTFMMTCMYNGTDWKTTWANAV